MNSSPQEVDVAARGDARRFLDRLLAFESGISVDRLDWYLEHYRTPSVQYPRVLAPGRPHRSEDGELVVSEITVEDYFRTLGVDEIFDGTAGSLRKMQYASMNALGFVGYQIGEAVLIDYGYYEPDSAVEESQVLKKYYTGVAPNQFWAKGRREHVVEMPAGDCIVATDANRWQGRFLCKGGIGSLDDLKVPALQELVMAEIMRRNWAVIVDGLAKHGLEIEDAINMSQRRAAAAGGGSPISASGLIAAAHLCGPIGTLQFLLAGEVGIDEFGTSILRYIEEFSGFEAPSCIGRESQPLDKA